jgi:hypothetical protein
MAEFAAGVPLAVGVAALQALNSFLDDKRIAIAWYGATDYKTFTRKKWISGRPAIYISHVFSVPESWSRRLIANSLENSQSWYWSRAMFGGECCWLPLYRTLEHAVRGTTIAEAQSAIFSLGSVGSLPAARMDMWALVVMAYANGANQSVISADKGAYVAVLRAKYFVLTIRRQGLTDQAIAHLEPREQPYNVAEPMLEQGWRNLLENGHSFGKSDFSGWPLYSVLDSDSPPETLITGELDVQLRNTIIDDTRYSDIHARLAQSVEKCCTLWHTCEMERRERGQFILQNRLETPLNVTEYGNALASFCRHTCDRLGALPYGAFQNPPRAIKEARNLKHDPMALYNLYKKNWRHMGWDNCWLYPELMRWHDVITVLIRCIALPMRLDRVLSTRGTGDTILLADYKGLPL